MKNIFSIVVLFLVISSSTTFCFGSRERNNPQNADSNAAALRDAHGDVQPPPNADAVNIDVSVWPDDPVLFMKRLTGHENIIKVNGNVDVTRIKKLLGMANLGITDSSGRRQFSYASDLRPAPATSIQRRLDSEIGLLRAARGLTAVQEIYVVIEYTIRSIEANAVDGTGTKHQESTYRDTVELVPDIQLIGRKHEETISYIVDLGNNTFGYGIYYLFSAIPIERMDSEPYKLRSAIRDNNRNAIMSILLERTTAKVED